VPFPLEGVRADWRHYLLTSLPIHLNHSSTEATCHRSQCGFAWSGRKCGGRLPLFGPDDQKGPVSIILTQPRAILVRDVWPHVGTTSKSTDTINKSVGHVTEVGATSRRLMLKEADIKGLQEDGQWSISNVAISTSVRNRARKHVRASRKMASNKAMYGETVLTPFFCSLLFCCVHIDAFSLFFSALMPLGTSLGHCVRIYT
jgi:hypothetical protein